jgi:hypothetical protein
MPRGKIFWSPAAHYRGLIFNLLKKSHWEGPQRACRCKLLKNNFLQGLKCKSKADDYAIQSYSHHQKFILLCGANL